MSVLKFRPELVFTELASVCWGHNINLDRMAFLYKKEGAGSVSGRGERLVERMHREIGVDCSYGGYGENRSTLLSGTYLDIEGSYLHLGVDFYVPARTLVVSTRRARVLRIDDDTPEKWGWGTRMFLKVLGEDTVLLYAHLSPDVCVKVGDELEAGTPLGYVGTDDHNGGWFPHLHIQAMLCKRYKEFLENPNGLDGYGHMRDRIRLLHEFPNPLPLLMQS